MRNAWSGRRPSAPTYLCVAVLLAGSALASAAEVSHEPVYMCERQPGQMLPQLNPCGTTPIVNLKPGVVYQPNMVDSLNRTREQNSPGYGTGANAVREGPDGQPIFPGQDPQPAPNTQAAPNAQPAPDGKLLMKDFRWRALQWLGIAIVVGLIAKLLLSRSFWAWFLLGLLVRPMLVAFSVINF